MKKISKNTIEALNPCSGRFDNYLKHYGNRKFTPRQFMGLKNITHQDKIWVAFRSISLESARMAAADIAESVLHIYESRYPGDFRPRKTIEAARTGGAQAAIFAAAGAANAAKADAYADAYATKSANFAAANAAAYVAYVANAAAADAISAASATVYASAAAAEDRLKQEKYIRTILLHYWKKQGGSKV